jgi:hypothetical protein
VQRSEHRLVDVLDGDEPVGMSELVLSGFERIVTNHRVYREPPPPALALEFCDEVLATPAAIPSAASAIFSALCGRVGARGNVVPDAFHAALLAIENGVSWITTAGGCARFPGLRRRPLLDD